MIPSSSHNSKKSITMTSVSILSIFLVFVYISSTSNAQRITTIQLDGVQYFVSRMNPYSPELNYFLAYQYCRSLGLQLASFETREKVDSITQYLSNAGYKQYDFWTSGNKLGTDMFLWMSTGLPFNATFNYMKKTNEADGEPSDIPNGSTSPQRTARESDSRTLNDCVALKAPTFEWDSDDCMAVKDFICEQTRCYYYNYGSIPVSPAQGRPVYTTTTTTFKPPYTSSSYSSVQGNKFETVGINDILSKLHSTTTALINNNNNNNNKPKDDVDSDDSIILVKRTVDDIEKSTNGPYSHGELQDDPAAMVYHENIENSMSTIEPDTVTTIPSNPY